MNKIWEWEREVKEEEKNNKKVIIVQAYELQEIVISMLKKHQRNADRHMKKMKIEMVF